MSLLVVIILKGKEGPYSTESIEREGELTTVPIPLALVVVPLAKVIGMTDFGE